MSGLDQNAERGSLTRTADSSAGYVKLHHRVSPIDRERHCRCLMSFLLGHGDCLVHSQGVHFY
jgi:hypothetical protein